MDEQDIGFEDPEEMDDLEDEIDSDDGGESRAPVAGGSMAMTDDELDDEEPYAE
jgi:hypothetical protein